MLNYEEILTAAFAAADAAIAAEVAKRPENERDFDCGFAWVTVDGQDGLARHCRAKLKAMDPKASYAEKSRYGDKGYPRGWQFWKPGNHNGQSVRIFEAGARGFRDELAKYGIRADVGSRLD